MLRWQQLTTCFNQENGERVKIPNKPTQSEREVKSGKWKIKNTACFVSGMTEFGHYRIGQISDLL